MKRKNLFQTHPSVSSIAILLFLFKKSTKQISVISMAAESISNGDLDFRVPIKSKDEIGRLAISINEMSERLKQNESDRDVFLASVSHELRTPLTILKANTQGIIDGKIPNDEVINYLKSEIEEIDRLTRMVNDLIVTSSFEKSNELAVERADVSTLLCDCIEQIKIIATQKKTDIDQTIQPKIIAAVDKMKLKQAFINVLDNAVQYAPPGSTVSVTANDTGNGFQITVSNHESRFEFDDPNRIFSRFVKGENSSGLGLGMYISKKIIEAHNGTITAENIDSCAQIKICIDFNL